MTSSNPFFFFALDFIRKEKTYDVLSIQRENGNGTKILRKSDISKETKKGRRQFIIIR